MEDIIEVIKSRRSIRAYKKEKIPRELVMKILEAGRWAPSASNNQPWRFVVIEDEEIIQQIAFESIAFGINMFVRYATLIIAIYSPVKHRWVDVDCGMCAQNMMLEAHSLGIGSCFVGAFREKAVKNTLGIPEKARIIGLITFGFPAQVKETKARLPLEELVSFNKVSQNVKTPSLIQRTFLEISGRLFRRKSS